MTTKRKGTQSVSRSGVRFVEDIVNSSNCIFQEIALENDIGNDAYLEFIENEEATGCCICLQIKSGDSYLNSNGNFILRADKDHFEYWSSHILPVAAIAYSPSKKTAAWLDVTQYIAANPHVVETGPYSINIPSSQVFDLAKFDLFKVHFLKYLEPYKHKIGVALEKFARLDDVPTCLDGIKYLLSFQRQNITSWYYLINCFQNFRKHSLLIYLTHKISYVIGHGDIFWNKENIIDDTTRKFALEFLGKRFGRIEVLCMLEIVTDGGGFARGAVGQSVEAIVSHMQYRERILESIAFDLEVDEESRYWAWLLLIFYTQWQDSGAEKSLSFIEKFQKQFLDSDSDISYMIAGIYAEFNICKNFNLFC